jgi:proline racemase
VKVTTVDYHAGGEPFRIVTGGVGKIPGATMLEKRRFATEQLDDVRRLLVNEPRGHADMYGCFVTEPVSPGADLGVVFFHNAGYSTACGHGTIALATAALETGMLPARDGEVSLTIDVPSGALPVVAEVEHGRVTRASFRNVPSFVHALGVPAETSHGSIMADVAYGGAFYASIDAAAVGLPVDPGNVHDLIGLGREIKRTIEASGRVEHPDEPELGGIYGVIFFQPEGSRLRQRNVTVFADGEVDRSPCGSGTSARLAILHARGEIALGETLEHLSVVGSRFEGRIVEEAEAAGRSVVVTEIAGSAHRTGTHEFVLEPDDPLGTGFLLR